MVNKLTEFYQNKTVSQQNFCTNSKLEDRSDHGKLLIIHITKVKKEFLDVIKEMTEEESTITVTKNGMPVGVMMTPERYEGLLETIEILADPKIIKALTASERDFRAGKVYTHKAAWADAGVRFEVGGWRQRNYRGRAKLKKPIQPKNDRSGHSIRYVSLSMPVVALLKMGKSL